MKLEQILNEKYSAYVLYPTSRAGLARLYPPKYRNFVGDHITERFGNDATEPEQPNHIEVVGYADSGDGLEAFVVSVDGTVNRPDGEIYHITWSLDNTKYAPKDSKDLVKQGWEKIDPIMIQASAALLEK